MSSRKQQYLRQKAIHERVVAIYPRFNEQRFFFRRASVSTRVPRELTTGRHNVGHHQDQIVNALVNKAASTKDAILVLCDAGFGDDALALSRVLAENAIIGAWLMAGNWPVKVDTYALSYQAHKRHFAYIIKQHFDNPKITEAADKVLNAKARKIADAVFGNEWQKWALMPGDKKQTTTGDMLAELSEASSGSRRTFLWDVVWVDISARVHSTPASVLHISSDLHGSSETFRVQTKRYETGCLQAARISNAMMLLLLEAFDEWLGARLGEQLKAIASDLGKVSVGRKRPKKVV
jgi:hypothetical protein